MPDSVTRNGRRTAAVMAAGALIVAAVLFGPTLLMMMSDSRRERVPDAAALDALRQATAGAVDHVGIAAVVVHAEMRTGDGSEAWYLFRAGTEEVQGLAAALREARASGSDKGGWIGKRDLRRQPDDTSIHAGLPSVPGWWKPDTLTDAQALEFNADGNFDLLILSPSTGQVYLLRSRM